MKRFGVTAAALAAVLFMTACSSSVHEPDTVEETAPPAATQPAAAQADTAAPEDMEAPDAVQQPAETDGEMRIFDEAGVLDGETMRRHNDSLCRLAQMRCIECGICITASLEGQSPESYAAGRYREAFGEGTDGFLILVNNDTGQDVIYTEGACSICLGASQRQAAVMRATPLLVGEQYDAALDVLESVGELIPAAVLDRAGVFTAEQMQALSDMAAWQDNTCGVLLLNRLPGAAAEVPPAQAQDTDAPTEEGTEAAETAGDEQDSGEVPEDTERAETEEDTAAAARPASSQELQALTAYAQTMCEQLGMRSLLVFDMAHTHCAVVGCDGVQDGIWQTWQEEGAYAACEMYFQKVQE